jgi:hypothetical protein
MGCDHRDARMDVVRREFPMGRWYGRLDRVRCLHVLPVGEVGVMGQHGGREGTIGVLLQEVCLL